MVDMIGDVGRLRPHIKTHKTREIIDMQMKYGIQKFKCATIAEAELLGQCSAKDILLAMQPAGVNITRFFELMDQYPGSKFSTIVDNAGTIIQISKIASSKNIKVPLFLDLNIGMNRTGIYPNQAAAKLCRLISEDPNLIFQGLHGYDGHIRDTDIKERKKVCDAAFDLVSKFKTELENDGIEVRSYSHGRIPYVSHTCKKTRSRSQPGNNPVMG